MLSIVHGSDLHFGRFHDAEAAGAFLSAVEAAAPGLIVLSGDLTQRAKIREYEAARAYLNRLPGVATVLTPGNHDVPLYRIFERWRAPYRNYRRYIQAELDTVTRVPGATVVTLNSTAPRRAIVNGRIRARQIDFARRSFEATSEGELRILVAHHHLASAPDYERDRPLPRAQEILADLEGMGVDLVLGGHLHRAYVASALDASRKAVRRPGTLIVQCGTTTSKRGRAREKGENSFNLIRADRDRLEVTRYLHLRDEGAFVPVSRHAFPRSPVRALAPGCPAAPAHRPEAPSRPSPSSPRTPPTSPRAGGAPH